MSAFIFIALNVWSFAASSPALRAQDTNATGRATSQPDARTEPVPTPSAILRDEHPQVLGDTSDNEEAGNAQPSTERTVLPATGAFPSLALIVSVSLLTAGSACGIAAHRRTLHAYASHDH